jgi:hypothetical protein
MLLAVGCSKKNCDKLVELACEHIEKHEEAAERCERLMEQSQSVDDDTCAETLQLLKESGRLQQQSK